MKKESSVNKKVLILSLVLLSLIIINFVSVAAQEAAASDSFFDRWVAGNIKDSQAKLLLWLMLFVILLLLLQALGVGFSGSLLISIPASFILVTFVTPASIIGVFKSAQTLPLVLATFLPLSILFAFTYLSVVKASRTLMTTQWFLWLIFLVYSVLRIFFSAWVYWEWGYMEYMSQVITLPTEAESFWYWASIFAQTIIAAIMVIGSGSFMNWALMKTAGIEDAAAARKFRQAKNALKHLADIEKDMAK